MKVISEIYNQYKIMPGLQKHMLRVASVASLICDNFNEPLPKKEIISACLLHDMGNIVKFKLDVFPEFMEPEGLDYWHDVQNEYFKKYGKEQHQANNSIAKELNVPDEVFDLLEHIGFSMAERNLKINSSAQKICAYSDMRVAPYGVRSLKERLDDLRERNKEKSIHSDDEIKFIHGCFFEMEKQIFEKCKIKPEDINDESIASIVLELRNFACPVGDF